MLQLDCRDLILNEAWINNQKTGSSDGRTFTVEDPADGTILATLPDCGPVEAEAATSAAHQAFSRWRGLLAKERAQFLQAWLTEIRRHKESGYGREGSMYGIDEYLQTKYLCLGGLGAVK
jgi:succinate-semialdehyde dehydrogenase / glutarate-semialdehyde dehydrogenase